MYLLETIAKKISENKIGILGSQNGDIFIDKFPPQKNKGILLSEKINTPNDLWSNNEISYVKNRIVHIYIYGNSNEVKNTRIKSFQIYSLFSKSSFINNFIKAVQASEPIFIGENANRQIIYLVELNLKKIKEA